MTLYGEIKVDFIGYAKVVMQMSEQELPIGYQLPDPYANHPANLAEEEFLQVKAKLPCNHYPNRSRYHCFLCRYEFVEKYIKEKETNK